MAISTGFTPTPQLQLQTRTEQRQKQTQVQRLSQQQIMSLKLLAMSSLDLRESIYREVEKNPALTVTHDTLAGGVTTARQKSSLLSDNERYRSTSATGNAASDAFQAALESAVDTRETLQEHLSHQFNATNHSADEQELGLALIHNLDAAGFHILAPLSLLNKSRPEQTEALLKKCMEEIRALDPVGTCCSGVEESLLIQAQLREQPPRAALFILHGHLPFLDPPQAGKVLKKIQSFLKERAKLSFIAEEERYWLEQTKKAPFCIEEIEAALAFIRTLDPYPARNFGSSQTHFVAPDVYVERLPSDDDTAAARSNAADAVPAETSSAPQFKITLAADTVPRIDIARDFAQAAENKAGGAFVQNAVREAKVFIDSVHFREATVSRAAAEIVRAQAAFFNKGERYLAPLRQKDIAEKLGVHEATISRMASGKYLQCEWGLFPFSYFFTNAVGGEKQPRIEKSVASSGQLDTAAAHASDGAQKAAGTEQDSTPAALSKEAVKYEVAEILKAHAADKKPLSDQKIANLLAERGITIARRTVAKYRTELNINSSFAR